MGCSGWSGLITFSSTSTTQGVLLEFHTYVMLRCCTFCWTSTHTSCYSAVHSLGLLLHVRHATLLHCSRRLPRIRHATLLYILLDFHTYVMLRCCTFSWTSTHTTSTTCASCYAAACSRRLPHIRHATLLYILLDFHTYVMLRCCTFSWTSTHTSCYSAVRSLGLPSQTWRTLCLKQKLKDRITPHVTNFFRLRLSIEKQEGKRKYKSDGAVMVGEFVCVMYVQVQ